MCALWGPTVEYKNKRKGIKKPTTKNPQTNPDTCICKHPSITHLLIVCLGVRRGWDTVGVQFIWVTEGSG